MSLSRLQKRKWTGCNGGPRSYSLPAHKGFRSSPPAPVPLMTDDENNPFPSDQITSDPTFFDDYVPLKSPDSHSLAVDSWLNTTPPTSTMGSPRSFWSVTKDPENAQRSKPIASLESIERKEKGDTSQLDKDKPSRATIQSFSRLKRRKLTPADTQPHAESTQVEDDMLNTNTVQTRQEPLNVETQKETMAIVATQAHPSPAAQAESQAESQVDNSPLNSPAPASKLSDTRQSELTEPLGAAARSPSVSSPRADHSIKSPRVSESMPNAGTIAQTPKIVRRSRRSLPTPTLVQSPQEADDAKIRKKKTQSKGNATKTTGGLQFSVSKTTTAEAYLVKHRNELQSEAGREWSGLEKQGYFHVAITKHARVRYALGDIVNVTFPRGQGGSAKIIEVRMADSLLMVVQWLYTRSDAVESGGTVPRLDQWPRDLHVLSDHFQIVCLENVDGKSDATPIDDHYWAAANRRMRPLAELEASLEKQLE